MSGIMRLALDHDDPLFEYITIAAPSQQPVSRVNSKRRRSTQLFAKRLNLQFMFSNRLSDWAFEHQYAPHLLALNCLALLGMTIADQPTGLGVRITELLLSFANSHVFLEK